MRELSFTKIMETVTVVLNKNGFKEPLALEITFEMKNGKTEFAKDSFKVLIYQKERNAQNLLYHHYLFCDSEDDLKKKLQQSIKTHLSA